jgi:hypothetical protein
MLSVVPKIGKSKHIVFGSGYISVHRQKRWGYTCLVGPDRLSHPLSFRLGKLNTFSVTFGVCKTPKVFYVISLTPWKLCVSLDTDPTLKINLIKNLYIFD